MLFIPPPRGKESNGWGKRKKKTDKPITKAVKQSRIVKVNGKKTMGGCFKEVKLSLLKKKKEIKLEIKTEKEPACNWRNWGTVFSAL